MRSTKVALLSIAASVLCLAGCGQTSDSAALFSFDGTTEAGSGDALVGGAAQFVDGIAGQALGVSADALTLSGDSVSLSKADSFSVQYWVRTTVDSDSQIVLMSTKPFVDNSLASQKRAGWVFYVSDGTWAWNIGSGSRRLTYERDNGEKTPINDGEWHQLSMTYDSALSEVRLYFDGVNRAIYHVDDATGFDFTNTNPVTVGWAGAASQSGSAVLPAIEDGAQTLQAFVDAFNALGVTAVTAEEFAHLIVDPRRLFDDKVDAMSSSMRSGGQTFRESMASPDFSRVRELESQLMDNPYTVHQVIDFVETAPVMQIFALVDGTVTIRDDGAALFAARERLAPTEFEMDELAFWNRTLSSDEVRDSYGVYFTAVPVELDDNLTTLTAASWNIWHGGKHPPPDENGWDARVAIADMIRAEGIDVVMMQETYSAGDFIAAELGYYFATTVDWDYLNQGANISVLSRYPIKEVYVPSGSAFMNVGVKLKISESQELYAMSNWYGMDQFPAVFEFHQPRFDQSASIPTVFAGDFNAVPHLDGGDSPASLVMLAGGFTDAFRQTFPDVEQHPGPTHRNNRRIDQLYFKGAGLSHTSTRQISTWPASLGAGVFPSDHFMIVSLFGLNYSTPKS